jgi:import inner membrane translocase subunit TIM22
MGEAFQRGDRTLVLKTCGLTVNCKVGKSSLWYGKSFGVVGFLFAGSECLLEKGRGRTDIWNNVGGGCMAGAVMAHKGGPSAMIIGCSGFAAFSLVIGKALD